MSNHVDVPASGATPAPEWTRSTSGASIRRVMVTSVVTVLVAAAVTATSVYLIADEAPTTGVFRDQAYAAAQAAEQQLVDGIDPATDLADILRFGAGAGAVSAAEAAYLAQMVYAIDPATNVPDALGLGTVACPGRLPAIEELVRGIDPSMDMPSRPRARDRPCSGRLPAHRGAGPGDRPIDGRASRSRVERSPKRTSTRGPRSRAGATALTSSKPGGRRGCGFGRTLGASCHPPVTRAALDIPLAGRPIRSPCSARNETDLICAVHTDMCDLASDRVPAERSGGRDWRMA